MTRKHPLANCEECPLFEEPGPVLGSGPSGPVRVAVVGEAPGFHESVSGHPFVGPSGQVLNELLRNNDIKREDVFVTNAVACRPPQNATPTQEAIDACSERLQVELLDAYPEYVLAMGATAVKALGLKGTMGKLRVGPPKLVEIPIPGEGSEPGWNVMVIPTWHPAYAMRLPDALPTIDLDISKINKGTNADVYFEPQLIVADDWDTAINAILDLHEMPGPFSVDIETGVEKDDQDVHADKRPLLCIGVGYAEGKVVVFGKNMMTNDAVMSSLAELFRAKPLIMHNGKSDVAGMHPAMGAVNLRYDTMLEHYTLDERTGGHKLVQLGIEMLGTGEWKELVNPYLAKGKDKNFADIPLDILYRYNAIDCDVTYRLHQRFFGELERQGPKRVGAHDHMVRAANQLVYPEMDGIGFDMPYSLALTETLQKQLAELEIEINDAAGDKLNPRSPQQLVKLFTSKGWHVPKGKKAGSFTTSAPALARALEDGQYDEEATRFLGLLFQHRDLAKDDGTFCRGLQKQAVLHEDGTYRIHTTYTLHVATTGRLSSRDPNLQNIKDKDYLRRQFVAADGNTFLQGDYSQVEGRVIAVLSGDPYLGDLFRNTERDIFDELSIAMYGKLIKENRRLLKTFFYGLSYGRTAHGIAQGFGMDLADASRQLEQFKELIPGVIEWQEATWQTVQDQGYLETTFGRRRHFPLITNRNKTDVRNEALAFVPQSTASDICLRAFTHLRPALEATFGQDTRIRLTIHDAIVTEAPFETIPDVRALQKRIMEQSGNFWSHEQQSDVPFTVAFKAGTSWDQLEG